MKLNLNQLTVDSYSTQVSENELTEIKGGSFLICSCASLKPVAEEISKNKKIEEEGCGLPDAEDVDENGCPC